VPGAGRPPRLRNDVTDRHVKSSWKRGRSVGTAVFADRAPGGAAGAVAAVERAIQHDGTLIEAWASMKSYRPKDDPKRAEGNIGTRPGQALFTTPR
jgi:hypothetical protein